ncbi:hypothetical protein, partial [Atlantibacter hermannii]|uniref:hypothetical protein n=1 Tax=Atlantibacter hermannii TaxID=565 RepID=UPI00289BE85E
QLAEHTDITTQSGILFVHKTQTPHLLCLPVVFRTTGVLAAVRLPVIREPTTLPSFCTTKYRGFESCVQDICLFISLYKAT